MIKENTLFILGAGASVPYGYPTGSQLRTYICKDFINDHHDLHLHYFNSKNELREAQTQVEDFVNAFNQSGNFSIDRWLARNPEFIKIGKRAITTAILKMEDSSKYYEELTPKNKEHDWYSYLFDRMTNTLIDSDAYTKFNQNKVGFITFNYDRSLEYYLQNSLRYSFSKSANWPAKFPDLISFPIYHVYGVISKLPWQDIRGSKYRPNLNYGLIESLQSNIRVINERADQEIDAIKNLISEAKRIFFLGFGYAEENLRVLDIPKTLNNGQEIFGTVFGKTERERKEIIERILDDPRFKHFLVESGMVYLSKDKNTDCLSLLREKL